VPSLSRDLPAKGPLHASTAVLLSRASSGLILSLPRARAIQLHATRAETLEFLLQGLSNKEIASRMKISPTQSRSFCD